MARLIDADRLLNDVRKHSASYFADDFAHEWVDQQPTVDAVEVVRCRECRWCNMGECEHKFGLLVSNDENYCSYGERDGDNG